MAWTAVKQVNGIGSWKVMDGDKIKVIIADHDTRLEEERIANFIADAFNGCSAISKDNPYKVARWISILYSAAKVALRFLTFCIARGEAHSDCIEAYELLQDITPQIDD
jgi:hypothetical protein